MTQDIRHRPAQHRHERAVHAAPGQVYTDGNIEYASPLVVTDGFPAVGVPQDTVEGHVTKVATDE